METIVSIFCDKLKLSRKTTTCYVTIFTVIVTLPSSLGFGILSYIQPLGMEFLDFFNFISNSILMSIVAFLTCIFISFIIKPSTIVEEVKISFQFKREKIICNND